MDGLSWALLGAALCAGLCCIGSAIGVSKAGRAAAGVLSEKPNLFGKLLVLEALSGTQGIYGFLIAILVVAKIGFLNGSPVALTVVQGQAFFAACMPMAIVGLISAIVQGACSGSAIMMTGKNESMFSRGITLTSMIETYAILALLVSVLMYNAIAL